MKKLLSIFLILFTVSTGFVFAESTPDPFDSLVEKLLKDFDDEGATVAVPLTLEIMNAKRFLNQCSFHSTAQIFLR